jgi:hypothetical protein
MARKRKTKKIRKPRVKAPFKLASSGKSSTSKGPVSGSGGFKGSAASRRKARKTSTARPSRSLNRRRRRKRKGVRTSASSRRWR